MLGKHYVGRVYRSRKSHFPKCMGPACCRCYDFCRWSASLANAAVFIDKSSTKAARFPVSGILASANEPGLANLEQELSQCRELLSSRLRPQSDEFKLTHFTAVEVNVQLQRVWYFDLFRLNYSLLNSDYCGFLQSGKRKPSVHGYTLAHALEILLMWPNLFKMYTSQSRSPQAVQHRRRYSMLSFATDLMVRIPPGQFGRLQATRCLLIA